MEENDHEILVRVTKEKEQTFMRFADRQEYKSFIAELIRGYKNTTYNVCTYTIHGLIRVIISNQDSKIIEKYQEL